MLDLACILSSVQGLALCLVMWKLVVRCKPPTGVLGKFLEATVTASLLPVPPTRPEAGLRGSASPRFALVSAADRRLTPCLAGRVGRWS